MRWVKRGLWVAAWGAWAWLGGGLYRELPRSLGPLVRTLPVGPNKVLGFVGQTNVVALLDAGGGPLGAMSLLLIDAGSGTELRHGRPPSCMLTAALILGDPLTRSLRFGAIVGLQPVDESSTPAHGLATHRLDLLSGDWLDVSKRLELGWSLHPGEPWLAHLASGDGTRPPRLVVFDYLADRELFAHDMPPGTEFISRPHFAADRNAVLVSVRRPAKPGNDSPVSLVMWTFTAPAAVVERPLSTPLGKRESFLPSERVSVSAGGRILFGGGIEPAGDQIPVGADVFDAVSNQFRSSIPPDERGARPAPGNFTPMIDPSGSTALRGAPPALYEVGTGRVLWRAKSFDMLEALDDQADFGVAERWDALWRAWFPSLALKTSARRRLATGELIVRTTGDAPIEPRNINAAQTLVVLNNGAVHQWPLRLNHSLLALCQTILALPLVLTWLALRWRQKRRGRVMGAAA